MEKRRRSTPAPPRLHLADHLAPPPRPIPSSVSTASPPCLFCARRCRPYRALGARYATAGIPPPPLRRGEHPATQPSPAQAPFLLAPALHARPDTFAPSPGPQSSLARARRRALPCRAAVAGAHAAQSLPDPDLSPRRVHHSVLVILGPSRVGLTPGAPVWASPATPPPRRAAFAAAQAVPRPEPPPCCLLWVTHAVVVPHGQTPAQTKPRNPQNAEIRRAPCRAAAEQGTPVTCAATPRPICPGPSDPDSTRAIRSWIHQFLTARSRSNGPRSKIPVRSVFLLNSPSLS